MILDFINKDRYTLKWILENKDKGAVLQWFSKGTKLTSSFLDNKVEYYYCNKRMID